MKLPIAEFHKVANEISVPLAFLNCKAFSNGALKATISARMQTFNHKLFPGTVHLNFCTMTTTSITTDKCQTTRPAAKRPICVAQKCLFQSHPNPKMVCCFHIFPAVHCCHCCLEGNIKTLQYLPLATSTICSTVRPTCHAAP